MVGDEIWNLGYRLLAEPHGNGYATELVYRAPDDGNPDPSVWRLVYADRSLTKSQFAAIPM